MSRIRLFTLLTACFLAASPAWADDLGYLECANHPEGAQLFSKARQTPDALGTVVRSEEHTSELQSQSNLVCRLLLEKKKRNTSHTSTAPAPRRSTRDSALSTSQTAVPH